MEVHHSHGIAHKKKWTEYLLEFFMLFLAVFLGFVAENIRESVVEGHRENQFMAALAKDLQLDTMQFAAIKRFNVTKLRLTDSVIVFFSTHTDEKMPAVYYRNAFDLIKGTSFFQNSGTIEQLKNSGGLRLIRKRDVVDSIQGYDQAMRRLVLRDKFEVDEAVKNIDLLQKLFDGQSLTKLFADTMFYKKPADIRSIMIPVIPGYKSEYLNHLREYRFLVLEDMKLRDQIALKAANLLMFIEKKYRL